MSSYDFILRLETVKLVLLFLFDKFFNLSEIFSDNEELFFFICKSETLSNDLLN